MQTVILIIYVAAGWWAANKVWYSKRVYLVHDNTRFYMGKLMFAFFGGWILIPIAIVMTVLGK